MILAMVIFVFPVVVTGAGDGSVEKDMHLKPGRIQQSVRRRTYGSAWTRDNSETMLVTFTTKAYADITMFGDIALVLLKRMGHSTTVPGAILAADVPAALGRLTAAMNAEKAVPPVTDNDEDEPPVSMAHRALPLINLLTAAAKADVNVMWK